jgi:putative endonuclease
MYIVYAINSQVKNYIYVGMTSNLSRRLVQHNNGHERTTKPYRPFQLIFTQSFPDRNAARVREKYLKSGVGKEFLRSLK